MRISNVQIANSADGSRLTATVTWDTAERPPFEIEFLTSNAPVMEADQAGNTLLAAAFPIAFHDREQRLLVDAPVCPMLADNLHTVLDCWNTWSSGPPHRMTIEAPTRPAQRLEQRGATAFLSGGVDSFHLLHRNGKVYERGHPAAIEQVILVHGFDIGKRARNAEADLFAAIRRRLAAVCDTRGIGVATCRTNLRHIKLTSGFWTDRFYGAAVLATGHAIAPGHGYLMFAGTYDFANLEPIGSSPVVDVLFSSQRLQIVHEGLRFSRLDKLRELAEWPLAIDSLRVCAHEGRQDYNCGTCEKCLRTRLGLLAVGSRHSQAFGEHAFATDMLDIVELTTDYHAACYRDIAQALAGGEFADLARGIEAKLAARPKAGLTRSMT